MQISTYEEGLNSSRKKFFMITLYQSETEIRRVLEKYAPVAVSSAMRDREVTIYSPPGERSTLIMIPCSCCGFSSFAGMLYQLSRSEAGGYRQ